MARQKGKGKAGQYSDSELALSLWEAEISRAHEIIADNRLALSMSTATASDQHILAALQEQEMLAERDWVLARSLEDDGTGPGSNDPGVESHHEGPSSNFETESICEVIGSLAKLSVMDGDHPLPAKSGPPDLCVSCMEKAHEGQIPQLPCGHHYCLSCIRELFLAATRNEELYPPRCCGNVFPPGLALRILTYKELSAFGAKAVEFTTTTRFYCGDPSCSAFIPPWSVTETQATCPRCHRATHTVCRTLHENPDHECPVDEALQQVLTLGDVEQWRRCPQCRSLVELQQGCNHITCR
jgi:hypothetical protein